MLFPVRDVDFAALQITIDLKKSAAWYHNSLLINPEKTKLLLLETRHLLQRVPAGFRVTLLGCKWTRHWATMNTLRTLIKNNREKHFLDTKNLLVTINALNFSNLYNTSSVRLNTSKKNIFKLQSAQNVAARIITNTFTFMFSQASIDPSMNKTMNQSSKLTHRAAN